MYTERAPYEILQTKDLSFGEIYAPEGDRDLLINSMVHLNVPGVCAGRAVIFAFFNELAALGSKVSWLSHFLIWSLGIELCGSGDEHLISCLAVL